MRARLRHARWIGGGSAAGKSTIARRLAVEHGLRVFSTDDSMVQHARRSNPADAPMLHAFLAMDMDERWVKRPPSVMFETFHWFRGEGFDLLLDDLLALPEEPPILAEGFRLLPRLVAPLLSQPSQAVWLVPSLEFRRDVFAGRGTTWFPYETSDPKRALANLLVRDRLFTDQVVKEAATLQLPVIEVNGTLSVDEVTRRVGESLGLATG
jgi:2-phosphoglycerate kinase